MTRAERLECRYRRLLWAYPAGYRAERGDEIVGVLLDCAGPGRSRPSVGDALDLTRGGLATRFRRHGAGTRGPWSDAFAILTVVLPILLAAGVLLQPVIQIIYRAEMSRGYPPGDLRSFTLWVLDAWKVPVAWLVVVVLLLGRKPRLAFAASVGATALAAQHLLQNPFAYQTPVTEALDALAVPVVATPLLSSAARCRTGVELVGRRGVAVVAVATALDDRHHPLAQGRPRHRAGDRRRGSDRPGGRGRSPAPFRSPSERGAARSVTGSPGLWQDVDVSAHGT